MRNEVTDKESRRRLGRSVLALIVGSLVAIILSIGTDVGLHLLGMFPALGQPTSDPMLLLATAYRTLYGVFSSYVVGRLAPGKPMQHALVGGVIGLVVSVGGAVATWNSGLGPHWYPLTLIALAIPAAWTGGKLRLMQLHGEMAAQ